MRVRLALAMAAAVLFSGSGCTAVSDFGSFKFGSDGGVSTDASDDASTSDTGADAPSCTPNEIPEVSCSGSVDNDCDGLTDCEDPDCRASSACCVASSSEVGPDACSDGLDNDCDGTVDCDESACATQANCCVSSASESDAEACGDGVDNDCDGKLDCADSDCAVVSACCEKGEDVETSCADAKDNDCDGQADCRDPDCAQVASCVNCQVEAASESDCRDQRDNDCDSYSDCWDSDCEKDPSCCVQSGAEQGQVACIDGVDNDCDGATDCADSECASALDCCVASDSESGELACADNLDNDCDGKVDCDDDGCAGSSHCCVQGGNEEGLLACNDHVDNDCDGKIDCADEQCGSTSTTCCIPSGAEADNPNDGVDNDCNGSVDIAQASASFPPTGQPVAGNEVSVTMTPSVIAKATLECFTRPLGKLGDTPKFTDCAANDNVVTLQNESAAADASYDGAWVTDIRWRFSDGTLNGGHSEPFRFRYYIHHTLYKATKCKVTVSDASWFDLARTRLGTWKTFSPDAKKDTSLLGPFAYVTYELPNANKIAGVDFFQDGTQQTVAMFSLRKRLVLDPDNALLLITRVYESTRGHSCNAAEFRYHIKGGQQSYICDAVALNREGAGVCMRNNGGKPEFVHDSNDPYANKIGWPKANKFMWRQLVEAPGRGSVHDYAFEENLSYRNFMPKCTKQPCASTNTSYVQPIFLPDRALFP